jgi:hypothetical protein
MKSRTAFAALSMAVCESVETIMTVVLGSDAGIVTGYDVSSSRIAVMNNVGTAKWYGSEMGMLWKIVWRREGKGGRLRRACSCCHEAPASIPLFVAMHTHSKAGT